MSLHPPPEHHSPPSGGGVKPWRRIDGIGRSTLVQFTVDGREVQGYDGEALASALALSGIVVLRHSPAAGSPRGMFCLMGSCQECLVHVDGAAVLACLEPVRTGMRVSIDLLRQGHFTEGPGR